MATIRRIDPLGGDPVDLDLWRQSWRLWNAGTRRQYGPDAVQVDADTLLEGIRLTQDPFAHLVATERDVVVGRLDLVKQVRDESGLVLVEFEVMPPWRDQGLGQAMWVEAEPLIAEMAPQALETHTLELLDGSSADGTHGTEAARHVLTKLGFAPVQTSVVSELSLRGELVDPPVAPGYRLEAIADTPDGSLMELLAQMHMELELDEPRGDRPPSPSQWSAERLVNSYRRAALLGIHFMTVLVLTDDGEVIGFSENSWTPKNAHVVRQGGTWIAKPHRGKGLATAAKGRAVIEMASLAPDAHTNRTVNAVDNVTMVSLNKALGYVPTHHQVDWRKNL